MATYPETARLSRELRAHKKHSGLSFSRYAEETGISRRTLQAIFAEKTCVLYETGKKLEIWIEKNLNQGVVLDRLANHK